jgi:hypothetical protein
MLTIRWSSSLCRHSDCYYGNLDIQIVIIVMSTYILLYRNDHIQIVIIVMSTYILLYRNDHIQIVIIVVDIQIIINAIMVMSISQIVFIDKQRVTIVMST